MFLTNFSGAGILAYGPPGLGSYSCEGLVAAALFEPAVNRDGVTDKVW